jgi:hypothetical protein
MESWGTRDCYFIFKNHHFAHDKFLIIRSSSIELFKDLHFSKETNIMNFRALGILVLIFTTEALAQQWGTEIRVTDHPGNSYRPDIACDSKGNVYVVWEDDRGESNFEIHYAKLDSNGAVLIGDTRLTYTTAASRYPKVAVDSQDRVYIVWRDSDTGSHAKYGLFCAILNENCQPILSDFIKIEGMGNGLGSLTPNIALDHFDNLHIVWDQNYTHRTRTDTIYNANEVCYTRIRPVGQVQIAKLILTEKGLHVREPAISVDHIGNLHVVWGRITLSNVDPLGAHWILEYAKFDSVGQPVLTPKIITPHTVETYVEASRYADIVTDSEGMLHCVYNGLRRNSFDIMYQKINLDGQIIVAETNLSQSPQNTGPPQMVSGARGTFHVVWDEDNFGTTNEIYYAKIHADGRLHTPRTRVDSGSQDVHGAAVAMSRSGRIFVVWYDNRYGNWDIMLRYGNLLPTDVHDNDYSLSPPRDPMYQITIYPSPTNSNTIIKYGIDDKAIIRVSIYDGLGRLVLAFPEQQQFPGYHTLIWDSMDARGRRVPSGIYICRLRVTGIKTSYEVGTKILVLR